MTRIGLTLAIASILSGCTTTSTLRRPRSAEELQAVIWDQPAYVTLLYEDPASTTPPALVPVPAPVGVHTDALRPGLSNVRGFDVKRRGLGGFEGGALAVALGFVAGTLLGLLVMSDDPPCDDPHFCFQFLAKEKAVFIGTLGAIAGLAIGAQIGANVGHTDRYLFVNP